MSTEITPTQTDKPTRPTSEFPFPSLPRELRDQIYKHLLTATYSNFPPYVCLSQTSLSSSPLALNEPQSSHPDPYSRLAILLVSRSIHEEAKYILHKYATFVFNNQSINSLQPAWLKDAKSFQNVVIELMVGYPYWDHKSDLRASIDLVNHFSAQHDSSPQRATWVVKFHFFHFLQSRNKDFERALAGLTGFRTVELTILHRMGCVKQEMSVLIPIFDRLGMSLEGKLGGEKVRDVRRGDDDDDDDDSDDNHDEFCAKYHPRSG